jgi:hypothetical protein
MERTGKFASSRKDLPLGGVPLVGLHSECQIVAPNPFLVRSFNRVAVVEFVTLPV